MSYNYPKVLLFGQTNVGKSTLFNRLIKKRVAVVHDRPGVTRDFLSVEVNQRFLLVDSGGLGGEINPFSAIVEERVMAEVNKVALILWVLDGKKGLTAFDKATSKMLRAAGKPVFLVINKIDSDRDEDNLGEFYTLGWDILIPVSAEHAINIDTLLQAVLDALPADEALTKKSEESAVKFAIVGRPNVGKSSLTNALLKENRVLVSEISGTTRDAVACPFEWRFANGEKKSFTLIDTAGLRKKFSDPVDYFASVRTHKMLQDSHLSLVLMDPIEGPTQLDKNLVRHLVDLGKGCILVVNKWDLANEKFLEEGVDGYKDVHSFQKKFLEGIKNEFVFLEAPVVFVSSKSNEGMETLLATILDLQERLNRTISTSSLNRVLQKLIKDHPPTSCHGKHFKIYYAVQTAQAPITLQVFCNRIAWMPKTYQRFLENGFRKQYSLQGCPVLWNWVEKPHES